MSAISEILSQYWWAVLIVIAIIVLLVSRKLGQTFGGGAVEIDVDRVVELLEQESVLLIDLAEQRTYQKGHIAGSVNMPGITFVDGTAEVNDVSQPIILVPMKGLIPMPVLQYLDSLGAQEVYIFKGGMPAWEAAGKPVEK